MSPSRDAAVARFRRPVETIEPDRLSVPVRAVWVYVDAAPGMNPVDRLGVHFTKDPLFEDGPRPRTEVRRAARR